jgi:hypothetical protein
MIVNKKLNVTHFFVHRSDLKSTLLPLVLQGVDSLSALLSTRRHYVVGGDKEEQTYDPRFMVFEFVWNLCLRQKQIEIVNMFRSNLALDVSKVKQMIMGGAFCVFVYIGRFPNFIFQILGLPG